MPIFHMGFARFCWPASLTIEAIVASSFSFSDVIIGFPVQVACISSWIGKCGSLVLGRESPADMLVNCEEKPLIVLYRTLPVRK
ncbi:hypothetical protein BGZ61DRAFT_469532 [Ilyonectria robusta]|uniref:uncharacterized protein n=1 Tax=Ilyonectria robusta TaxID=1079257 RepID=UPI001E8D014C|nr:uncharacterized protein BGZ61DRAFT_469532 [Ilyonectria robusta]KAH8649583.1 hypothetical protein BGZ61DRAFT_469532 [Ilyonectria robusta]